MDNLIREMASRPGELDQMEEASWVREKNKREREEASRAQPGHDENGAGKR